MTKEIPAVKDVNLDMRRRQALTKDEYHRNVPPMRIIPNAICTRAIAVRGSNASCAGANGPHMNRFGEAYRKSRLYMEIGRESFGSFNLRNVNLVLSLGLISTMLSLLRI